MDFTDEQMAVINEMIAEKVEEHTNALKTKNAELISEKRAATTKANQEAEAREEAERTAAEKAGDIEALKKSLTDKHSKEIEARDSKLRELLVDGAISAAIAKGNVMPGFVDAVTALYQRSAKYENGAATIEGKDIGDYISEHLASEAGGAFVRAPANSGGGAVGSQAKAATMTKENFNYTEWAKMKVSNPAEANSVAKAAGMGHLVQE